MKCTQRWSDLGLLLRYIVSTVSAVGSGVTTTVGGKWGHCLREPAVRGAPAFSLFFETVYSFHFLINSLTEQIINEKSRTLFFTALSSA